ncbi:MAG TPA: reverse transcriptase domain-containing protein [Acidimicrobiales bacterium]|nr:reverse transcriptase domain-containing protein [Acidimicrobiales bacterium]
MEGDGPWEAAVELFRARNPRRTDRLADYEALLAAGAHRCIGAAVLAGEHRPEPPAEGWLNRAGGRKKRVFTYPPADELLFRVLNRMLQPAAAEAASPHCRSFLPGGGARSAFRAVLADRDAAAKAAVRLDVRDYFNSIDVEDLLARLPDAFAGGPVGTLLGAALRDRRVVRDGAEVDGGRKGMMAGTPLAPLLATLYLRDVDDEVAATGATYARYSDDVLVLAPPDQAAALERLVRSRLAERGLAVNEGKSSFARPGLPWDFLGFRFHAGAIGLAPATERKLKARATRLARSLLRWRERAGAPPERACGAFVRRTNLRLYGVPAERGDFSWATWFLPLLARPDGLPALDEHLRREARYASTGRRTAGARRLVPYEALVEAGHLPLVNAYWAVREGRPAYEALVGRRTGLRPPASNG